MELAEKLEEAVVAYLNTLTWPDSLKDESGALQIFAGESSSEKTQQCILCIAEDNPTEEPNNSGNCVFSFRVELRTPVADPSPIDDHKVAADALENALMAANLGDLVNTAAYAKAVAFPADFADLDNFCLYPVISRTPIREQDEEMFVSGRAMSCYCMGIKG